MMTNVAIVAVVGDDTYNVLLATHLLAVVAAFGPTLVYTLLGRLATRTTGEAASSLAAIAPTLNKRTSLPALVIAVAAGIGLIIQSDKAYTFDMAWVSASFTLVLVLGLVAWFFLAPALKRLQAVVAQEEPNADEIRKARAASAMATGLIHIGLLALVVLMVWKPV